MMPTLLAYPWFAPLLAALLAVPLALLGHRVAGLVLERLTRSVPTLHATLLAIKRPALFVLPLVALQLVWQAAPEDLRFVGNVRHLNGLALIGAATWLAVRAVGGFAEGMVKQHPSDVVDNLNARRVLTQARVLAAPPTPCWWWPGRR